MFGKGQLLAVAEEAQILCRNVDWEGVMYQFLAGQVINNYLRFGVRILITLVRHHIFVVDAIAKISICTLATFLSVVY